MTKNDKTLKTVIRNCLPHLRQTEINRDDNKPARNIKNK